jgi:hypothetical protein
MPRIPSVPTAALLAPAVLFSAPAAAQSSPAAQEGRLRVFDREGRELFAFDFEPDAVPHASDPSERHFGFVVPLDPSERARLDHWSERVELPLADGLDLWRPGASGAPERQP